MSPTPDLSHYWMPFTANRYFKAHPLLMESARGMYYQAQDGRHILDAIAGLWCCNAGHCHPRITAAIQAQAARLDYATAFQLGHPTAFELATRLAELAPAGLEHVFFTNSGSEAVDTALKIARAFHQHNGQPQRTRLVGRERGYHGVGFGGISVGGIETNRRLFGPLLPEVEHLPSTHLPDRNAFCRGQPAQGAELADELEVIIAAGEADTIAAVIVEPVAGSAGVLVPPVGYLQRLRQICDRHGILLIFDEVITGLGRLGAATAADYFGVRPDLMTLAKALTNGTVPMGAVLVDERIHAGFMQGPEQAIELFHGYTYSGHPLAAAAALASLDVYADEELFAKSRELAPIFEQALHQLAGSPHVIDIRNLGLMGAIELEPRADAPTQRAQAVFRQAFEQGILIRTTADTLALTPPLIISEAQIGQIVETLQGILQRVD
ncbi:MAG: aspartate aminotransferase family protein [Gammaproteobacteria bacterium]